MFSSPEKVRVALVELVAPLGASERVGADGADVSTVHEAVMAALKLPAASLDLIETEWLPSAKSVRDRGELQVV